MVVVVQLALSLRLDRILEIESSSHTSDGLQGRNPLHTRLQPQTRIHPSQLFRSQTHKSHGQWFSLGDPALNARWLACR